MKTSAASTFIIIAFILPLLTGIGGCREREKSQTEYNLVMGGVLDVGEALPHEGNRGGRMARADLQELDTLNIVTTRSRSLYALLGLVFEGLLSTNPITGEVQSGLAREYQVVRDGLSILLTLNREARFSDGSPCTADDVLFSFEEIYMNPEVDTKKADVLRIRDNLVTIHKIDEYTVRIDLPVPYRPFRHTLTDIYVLPKHILEPLIREQGIDAFNKEWGRIETGTDNLVGTGPYMVSEVVPGQHLLLKRNP